MCLFKLNVLLLHAITLVLAADHDSSTLSRQISIHVDPPSSQWSTGQPYATVPLFQSSGAATPTFTKTITTTSLQVFPSEVGFVATGLAVSPIPPNPTSFMYNTSQVLDGIPGYVYSPLRERSVEQSAAFTINLNTIPFITRCWYPVSGNYGQSPRILFYITIAAAIILRGRLPQLYIGALAASLTYSGSTAIHACLLVWRGPAWGDLDLFAMLAILSVSCIIMVPLITWSSTIRTAGRPDLQIRENDERPKAIKELDASARTILIFWSFLVTTGFLCAFVALQDENNGPTAARWSIFVQSGQQSFSCAPPTGSLNVTAGQPPAYEDDGLMNFNFFLVTQEFVDANNCRNPCSNPVGGVTIFRTEADLALLTLEESLVFTGNHRGSSSKRREFAFVYQYQQKWSYLIIYVLLGGIWTVCFGRSKPSQIRTLLYGYFSRIHLSGIRTNGHTQRGHIRRLIAQAIALGAYSWSIFNVLVAIPLLIVNTTVLEFYMSGLPQSEIAKHVGSWAPFASTGLVLVAAALAKSYTTIKAVFLQTSKNAFLTLPKLAWHKIFGKSGHSEHQSRPRIEYGSYSKALIGVEKVLKAAGESIIRLRAVSGVVREWNALLRFIRDPEQDWAIYDEKYGHRGNENFSSCDCPEDYSRELHPMCPHNRSCTDDSKCGGCKTCDGEL